MKFKDADFDSFHCKICNLTNEYHPRIEKIEDKECYAWECSDCGQPYKKLKRETIWIN